MKHPAATLLAAALMLGGCVEAPTTGAELYGGYCARCHGADARGGTERIDGKLPPDLTTLAKRHGGTFPSDYVMSTIDGYAREATHGPMPTFGDLIESKTVAWVDADGVPTPTPLYLTLLDEYLRGQQEE